jgi:hypothetical protein
MFWNAGKLLVKCIHVTNNEIVECRKNVVILIFHMSGKYSFLDQLLS